MLLTYPDKGDGNSEIIVLIFCNLKNIANALHKVTIDTNEQYIVASVERQTTLDGVNSSLLQLLMTQSFYITVAHKKSIAYISFVWSDSEGLMNCKSE